MHQLYAHSLTRVFLFVMVLTSVSGCDDFLSSDNDRRLGVIVFYDDPVVITVPDTVFVGQPFSVSVRTYGNGCLSQGNTKVRTEGLSVDVTPYDIHNGTELCIDILNKFDHTASVTLTEPGTAEIRFHGKQLPENTRITEVREVVLR